MYAVSPSGPPKQTFVTYESYSGVLNRAISSPSGLMTEMPDAFRFDAQTLRAPSMAKPSQPCSPPSLNSTCLLASSPGPTTSQTTTFPT